MYRDFNASDLKPHLDQYNIDGTILIQASASTSETSYLLSLARKNPFIKGVVGWVDFDAEDAAERITTIAQDPHIVGLRPMIRDIDDIDWMLRPNLAPAFQAMIDADLTFDALTLPHHLSNLHILLEQHPNLRTVINHCSKPEIKYKNFATWAAKMAVIARETDAYCKLSGIVTEAKPDWTLSDFRPYFAHLLVSFGPDRLIWGSDWPVCTTASTYGQWIEATEFLLSGLTASERAAIMGKNAIRVYGLGPSIPKSKSKPKPRFIYSRPLQHQ